LPDKGTFRVATLDGIFIEPDFAPVDVGENVPVRVHVWLAVRVADEQVSLPMENSPVAVMVPIIRLPTPTFVRIKVCAEDEALTTIDPKSKLVGEEDIPGPGGPVVKKWG
jgi:hypothetical protein